MWQISTQLKASKEERRQLKSPLLVVSYNFFMTRDLKYDFLWILITIISIPITTIHCQLMACQLFRQLTSD